MIEETQEVVNELDHAFDWGIGYLQEHPVIIIIFAFILILVLCMAIAGSKKQVETRQNTERERPRRIIYEY